jgi:hypothetical protein
VHTQQSRDEKTVVIATGLGLVCLIVALGGLVLWGVYSLFELSESTVESLLWGLIVAAGFALVGYLVRANKR